MDPRIQVLAEHYQKTYELTYSMWDKRNRTFLMLLGVIAGAALLTFRVPQADSLIVDIVVKLAGINDPRRVAELRAGFPIWIFQALLMAWIFYLVVGIYHRAVYVLRNYQYLSRLECEIRQLSALPADFVAFTRESEFYWASRGALAGWVKWVYVGLLGVLLVAFFGGRLAEDIRRDELALVLIDVLIALPTFLFYLAYAASSVSLDSPRAIIGSRVEQPGSEAQKQAV